MKTFKEKFINEAKKTLTTKVESKGSFNGESGMWYTVWKGNWETEYMVFLGREQVYLFKDDSAEEKSVIASRNDISFNTLDLWVSDQIGK